RIRKLDDGVADATLLALAGLKRLGLAHAATAVLEVDEFLPAVGQGAVGLETRANGQRTRALVASVDGGATSTAPAGEPGFLEVLDGSCKTPIAGHARIVGGRLEFRGMILKPDGSEAVETQRTGAVADAVALGADAGRELRSRGGTDFFR